jgi:hypothetical protein
MPINLPLLFYFLLNMLTGIVSYAEFNMYVDTYTNISAFGVFHLKYYIFEKVL